MSYTGEGGLLDLRKKQAAGYVSLDADGQADITYPWPFKSKPVVQATPECAQVRPVMCQIEEHFTNVSGEYTGARVCGYRIIGLPSPLLNLAQLVGFLVAQGSNDTEGIEVGWVATGRAI